MKSILFRLAYACLFLITIFSCNNDADAPQATIHFTVNSTYEKYWIVLSNPSGKVLTWKAMTNTVTETFTYTATERIMLTVVSKSNANDFTMIKSYADIKPGDYSIDVTSVLNSGTQGKFTVNITNPDNFLYVFPQSEGSCGSGDSFADPSRIDLTLCDDNTNLFIPCTSRMDDGTPRYLYKDNINKNGSITIDNNLFEQLPAMKTKTVTFDEPIISGFSIIDGRTIKKKQTFLIPAFFISHSNITQLKIYYPDLIGTLFSSYVTTIGFSREKNVQNYITKESIEPPTSYPGLDVNFNFADSSKITTESISASVSGKTDYIFIAFNYFDANRSGWWFVNAPFANDLSIRLPVFPDNLKAAAELEIISKMKPTQISFIENKGLGGYEGFYPLDLSLKTQTIPHDRRSKVYELQPNGVTYGRTASPWKP